MGVAGPGDVFTAGGEFDGCHRLGDQVAGLGTNDVNTQDAIGLGIRQNLYPALGISCAPARPLAP